MFLSNHLKKIPWRDVLLVGVLILIDLAIHPLTAGPDRQVHDPAVYRLWDPNYLPGDWYTGMAVKSGIYLFYAKLVNAWHFLGVPEEPWRMILYLACLALLYYALIRIARLFSKSLLVVPVVALLHAFLNTGANQPAWLYGAFLQIDGGLAPRTVGMALSFLSLFFLLRGSTFVWSALLGLATLFHPSNSIIVFTLFLTTWVAQTWMTSKDEVRDRMLEIGRKAALALGVYLLAGGWFAFYAAIQGTKGATDFTPEKFIWTWTYFRARYLALPEISWQWWLRFFAHVMAIFTGWFLLRKNVEAKRLRTLDILGIVGLGSVAYFFLFYLFAFVWHWLPGFRFYSIRVVYLTYFVAYLFISLLILTVAKRSFKLGTYTWRYKAVAVMFAVALLTVVFGPPSGGQWGLIRGATQNVHVSWLRLLDSSVVFRSLVPESSRIGPPQHAVLQYLLANPQPLLAPPDWNGSLYLKLDQEKTASAQRGPHVQDESWSRYLPNIASFKSFGFTEEGLPEWFRRINDVSGGEIQRIYEVQTQDGQFKTVELNWEEIYPMLTNDDVLALSSKYNFRLFLTYRNVFYPFHQVAEDEYFRLYQLP
jgi:hypothetical protein